jgi:medium-chain acyl-[acyl-carrier-protein] hydrolase
VEVCAVELPGRGLRIREPLVSDVDLMTRAMAEALLPFYDLPFAFFGHSMGGLLAFELTRSLRRQGRSMPRHLFISACAPPHIHDTIAPAHKLPDAELVRYLMELDGTEAAVFENEELRQLFLPIIRSDLALVDSYNYRWEQPLSCPVSTYIGVDDVDTSSDRMQEWQQHTSAECSLEVLPGNHFFILGHRGALLRQLSSTLRTLADQQVA